MHHKLSSHLFHQCVPLAGHANVLVPLSRLRALDEPSWRRAWSKYDGDASRRRLRDSVIPLLERRWTEVVFLTPIDPTVIWRAWRDLTGQALPSQDFWAIPAEDVNALPAVVLDRHRSSAGNPLHPDDVEWFDPAKHRTLDCLPPASQQWLAELASSGRRGAWFNRTPQILVDGDLSLHGVEVIDWSNAAP